MARLSTRRRVLKILGASSVVGLAGCTGEDGGGGGTGADGGGGGDGGDGGGPPGQTSATTNKGEPTTLTITSFPTNYPAVANKYAEEEGIFEEEMGNAGYDYELTFSFDGSALYAAGKSHIALDLGPLDAARMAERGIHTTTFGRNVTAFTGMYVKVGSQWDPDTTGSVEATINKVAEENGKVGIFGWGAGTVPVDQMVIDVLTGKKLQEKQGDFDVVTAKPPAIPQLINQGEVAMASTSPVHGAADAMLAGDIRPVYLGSDLMAQRGMGTAPLSGIATRDEFLKDHPEAVRAALRAYDRGVKWMYGDGREEIPQSEKYRGILGAKSAESAEYIMKWMVEEAPEVKYGFQTDTPRLWRDAALTDEWIQGVTKFLGLAVDRGQIPGDWDQFLTFESVEL